MINELESTKSESAGSADVAVAIEPQTAPEENPAAVCETAAASETAAESRVSEQDAWTAENRVSGQDAWTAENRVSGQDARTAESRSFEQDARETEGVSDTGERAETERGYRRQSSRYREDFGDVPGMDEERRRRRFWRFGSGNDEESRDKLILSRIRDEDLMEYLALEQRRVEFLQQAKEAKEKRILNAFQLIVTLAAIVALTYLLRDNPTILISILYVAGIVAVLKVWRNPQDNFRGR